MKRVFALIALCAICATSLAQSSATDIIKRRRSIRNYTTKPVEHATLQKIAEYGLLAPNARNLQEWEIRIVESQEWLERCTNAFINQMKSKPGGNHTPAAGFRNMFRNASAVIFVAAKPDGKHDFSGVNIGMLSQNIMLAATEMGLGTCFLGSPLIFLNENNPEGSKFLAELGFSEGYTLRGAIAIGYADETPKPQQRDMSKIKFVK